MNVQQCSAMKREAVKLMAQFQVVIPGRPGVVASVRRGMTVHCSEGRQVANVAAVAVGLQNEQVFCLILGYLPQKELYQSVPISWIDRVEGESVILNVCFDQIQGLPEWYPV